MSSTTDIVVIGVSMGGLHALEVIVSRIPADCSLPIVIAQHRSVESSDALAAFFRRHSSLRVREPDDKETIVPGTIYIAPPDYHLIVEYGRFALSTAAPVNYSRPSIDVLFESAADAYGPAVLGVVLTGANADGAHGAARIKAAGGTVVVQNPSTAESSVMPASALRAVTADAVLDLASIGDYIAELCRQRRAPISTGPALQ